MSMCNLKINDEVSGENCPANSIESVAKGVYIKINDFNPLCANASTVTKPLMNIFSIDGECIESYGISNRQINFDTLDNEFVKYATTRMKTLNQVNLPNNDDMTGAVELRPTTTPVIGSIYNNGYVFIDGRSLEYNHEYNMFIWYTVKSNPIPTDTIKFAVNSDGVDNSIPIAPIGEKTLARMKFKFTQNVGVPNRKCLTMFVDGCNIDVHGIVFVDVDGQSSTITTSVDGSANLPTFKNGATYIVDDPNVITDIHYSVDSNVEIEKIYDKINLIDTELSKIPQFNSRDYNPYLQEGYIITDVNKAQLCFVNVQLTNNEQGGAKQFKLSLGAINRTSNNDYVISGSVVVSIGNVVLYTVIINQDDFRVSSITWTKSSTFPGHIDLNITRIIYAEV